MESFLLVSDLHLTDDPWDEYRWGLFDWMAAQQAEFEIDSLYILGDLTDKKDNHSAILTNRVASKVEQMAQDCFARVGILMGNHDFLLAGHPFFRFLQSLGDNIFYAAEPTVVDDMDGDLKLFLPYAKDPSSYWRDYNLSDFDIVFLHQTVTGALASNGMKMEGIRVPLARGVKIWSGDIHVPQMIGNVEYVGSPYPVHFGDRFEPRAVFRDSQGAYHNWQYPSISKFSTRVRSPEELHSLELVEGDQVKLRVVLPQEDLGQWNSIRQAVMDKAATMGIAVRGIELVVDKPPVARVKLRKRGEPEPILHTGSASILESFAKVEKLEPPIVDEGLSIIHENN